jgi:hypothetical protein
MKRKSWHLNRRTFLHGTGISLALPYLECMGANSTPNGNTHPARLCCSFFANGVSLPPENHPEHEKWHWFPIGEGKDYKLTQSLKPLEPFRKEMTILGGLSHPLGRLLVGHATGDIWLTGGDVRGSEYRNSISIDQKFALSQAKFTRIPSLVLSSNGGVGYKTRTATISFNQQGEAIPAESMPRQIFERLFQQDRSLPQQTRKRQIDHDRRIIDLVLKDSKSLRYKLGTQDKAKLDEYLQSVHEIEARIDSTERWLGTPLPQVDENGLNLEADQKAPEAYIRTLYDLVVLAFQTDTTRTASYLISQEDGKGVSDKFPAVALGLSGHHSLSHGTSKEKGYENWARYDQFLASQHAYFLDRLRNTQEGDGSLLDSTVTLFGSATSTTHNARNYPLVLAGGSKLGLRHGEFRKYTESTPLSNLFVTLLDKLKSPVDKFADSTGGLSGIA